MLFGDLGLPAMSITRLAKPRSESRMPRLLLVMAAINTPRVLQSTFVRTSIEFHKSSYMGFSGSMLRQLFYKMVHDCI